MWCRSPSARCGGAPCAARLFLHTHRPALGQDGAGQPVGGSDGGSCRGDTTCRGDMPWGLAFTAAPQRPAQPRHGACQAAVGSGRGFLAVKQKAAVAFHHAVVRACGPQSRAEEELAWEVLKDQGSRIALG